LKKKTKRWYKNDEKAVNAVKYCSDLGFSEKETEELLNLIDLHPHIRTVRRIKKELPKQNKLELIVKRGTTSFHLKSIEMLEDLIKKMKKIGDESKNSSLKIQAYDKIPRMIKDVVELYDTTPEVKSFSQENGQVLEKP